MTIPVLHTHGEMAHASPDIAHALLDALGESLYICLLVILMMTLIEIFNVTTHGKMFRGLERHGFAQTAVAAVLGVVPGCIGGFAGVSLYSHRMISFGALVAMLIATTGDESFMMLAMFPGKALAISGGLLVLGIAAGTATDLSIKYMQKHGKLLGIGADRNLGDNYEIHPCDCGTEHSHEDCSTDMEIQHKGESHAHHKHKHGSKYGSIMHFMKAHVWQHVIRRHLPTIFAWTFAVLALFNILSIYIDMETWIRGNTGLMILAAVLIGLIPESGPHLIFVSMYASGILPFPVLLASCIAQDGHACLPLIAENKRSWLSAKLLKSALAIAAGCIAMMF